MPKITIRDLPEELSDLLRARAREHGRSLEAEAQTILTAALEDAPGAANPQNGSATSCRSPKTVSERREAWLAFRRFVQERIPPERCGIDGVDELIRDRRRELIRDAIRKGEDPKTCFGDSYSGLLAQARWSEVDVETLKERLRSAFD